MRAAARSVGQRIEILQASTAHDIETAFASLIGMQVGALLVGPDPVFVTEANQLVALAARHSIPTLYWRGEFAEAGSLMSDGLHSARRQQCALPEACTYRRNTRLLGSGYRAGRRARRP